MQLIQRFKVHEIYTHLQWLENDFLGYLKEWKDSVAARDDVTKAQKPRMCLSKETLEGLHITGIVYPQKNSIRPKKFYLQFKSFVAIVRYLLGVPGVQYILSEKLSQDPLENYFGQQRARGGRCDNPTMSDCLHSAQSLRVQRSFALQPVRGNCSKKRKLFQKSPQPLMTLHYLKGPAKTKKN